ncbi:hypothetical protein [Streptomyces alboflavus]|uniref:hypothetical protein n=1 Tax=Streptomyces alboflavus TaxID=67267 RepID=UPI000F656A03|nr:hypothetical protein [Streptomyces alboflavus]
MGAPRRGGRSSGRGQGAPTTVRCDSPLTVGRFHTAPGKQRSAISAEGGAHWALAVVDGRGDL